MVIRAVNEDEQTVDADGHVWAEDPSPESREVLRGWRGAMGPRTVAARAGVARNAGVEGLCDNPFG